MSLSMILLISVVFAGSVYAVVVGWSRIVFYKRLRNLEIAMVRYPNYADVRAQLGSLYYSYGKFKKAKQYYYEALKIYQYFHYARLKLGLICLETNEIDEAMYHFRKIRIEVTQDPTMINLLEGLMKEKFLYEEYMKDPDPELNDDYFKKDSPRE